MLQMLSTFAKPITQSTSSIDRLLNDPTAVIPANGRHASGAICLRVDDFSMVDDAEFVRRATANIRD
eukprot:1447836-Prorocentrum_lima.AAC.1